MVKLIDFGMLLDLSKEPHARGIMGSPGFVAPEACMNLWHSTQMDCYSLGVMLFVMLVGSKPMSPEQGQGMQYARLQPHELRNMQASPSITFNTQ
jgi:serine/threonine protein kinase